MPPKLAPPPPPPQLVAHFQNVQNGLLDADGNPPDVHDPGTHAMPRRPPPPPAPLPGEARSIVRSGTTYRLHDPTWFVLPQDRPGVARFPTDYAVPDVAGVTVAVVIFAERISMSEYPFWAEFRHPMDGSLRSVFLRREWLI